METLRKSRDYRRVIESGKREILETIITYRLPNQKEITRVGVSVTKKAGNSVKRNRTRRRIKEAIRRNASFLPEGEDVVIVARRAEKAADYLAIEKDIRKLGSVDSIESKNI